MERRKFLAMLGAASAAPVLVNEVEKSWWRRKPREVALPAPEIEPAHPAIHCGVVFRDAEPKPPWHLPPEFRRPVRIGRVHEHRVDFLPVTFENIAAIAPRVGVGYWAIGWTLYRHDFSMEHPIISGGFDLDDVYGSGEILLRRPDVLHLTALAVSIDSGPFDSMADAMLKRLFT